jgi:hypothetical protein
MEEIFAWQQEGSLGLEYNGNGTLKVLSLYKSVCIKKGWGPSSKDADKRRTEAYALFKVAGT